MAQPTAPAAPATQTPPVALDPGLRKFSNTVAWSAVLGTSPFIATVFAFFFAWKLRVLSGDTVSALLGVTAVLALAGTVVAVVAIVRLRNEPAEGGRRGRWLAVWMIPLSVLAAMWGAIVAVISGSNFHRGRQIRSLGRPVFARLVADRTWIDDVVPIDAPPSVAHAWRENGKTEHASVAAFAKLAMELVALGAPSKLVEAAHRDALDEIRHARLCFSVAAAIDGEHLEPGELPAASSVRLPLPREARLAQLAVEALIDGALNEGTSARALAKLARRTTDGQTREVVLALARDEGRHAAHGFDVLAWCLSVGGRVVSAAVAGALQKLPRQMGASLFVGGDDGSLERWGVPGKGLLDEAYAELRAHVVARVSAMLDERRASLAAVA